MKKYFLLFILVVFASVNVSAQTYEELINQADSLYTNGNYKQSSLTFQQAFKIQKKDPDHLYNAACSAALAGEKEISFACLEAAIQNGWVGINHMKKDEDLNSLHDDKRWSSILNKLQKKIDEIEAGYDKPLQKELLQILEDDQKVRNEYSDAMRKPLGDSSYVDSLAYVIMLMDSINLVKVSKILDEKGWVGKDKVGASANEALFLVIQHSELNTQEKYLPMMRDAVKKGNANAGSLALLEDRVAIRQGRKQIYGSQIYIHPVTKKYYVGPLEDPDNVDKRRSEVGLNSLAEYVKRWDIIWNAEEYKKQLPEYLKLQQEMLNRQK